MTRGALRPSFEYRLAQEYVLLASRLCGVAIPRPEPVPVRDFAAARKADAGAFRSFFAAMLDAGVYLAPSPFEAGFVSLSHRPADVAATLRAARVAFHEVAKAR